MKIEWWKFIPGFGFDYMVSDQGRVLSLNYKHTGKIKILKQALNEKGYLIVCLCVGGKRKFQRVHRLVAFAFIPNPHNYPQCNHINERKTDNRAENLEWCDGKYNCNYGTRNKKVAAKHSKPVNQFTKKGEFVASYSSTHEAHRQTGINQGSISSCCLNRPRYKSAGGYRWAYA